MLYSLWYQEIDDVCCINLYSNWLCFSIFKIRKETWIVIFRYIELPGVLQLYRHESFTGEFLRLSCECTWPRRRCTHAAWGVSTLSYIKFLFTKLIFFNSLILIFYPSLGYLRRYSNIIKKLNVFANEYNRYYQFYIIIISQFERILAQ